MPVVPGYRARSATEISSIPLDPGLNFRDNTRATPEMFGAGIGRALGAVGQGMSDVGQAITAVKAIDDANYAKEADAGFSGDVRDLGYGENGYFGKQGAAAIEGLKGFEESLRQSAQKRAAALPPGAQRGFMSVADQRIQSTLQSAYSYAMDQRKNWSIQTGNALLDGFQNDALTNYTDPNAVNAAIDAGKKEIRSNPAYSPEIASMKEREYVSTVRYNTGLRLLTDDPKRAEAYFNEHKTEFSGEDQYKFGEALKTPLLNANVRANTAAFFQNGLQASGGATSAPLESANLGSEPAPGDAAALLRQLEGFRSSPYWDVNAYRVGYGSDTITRADGSVVKVTPGMTVTREDAERDLTRRINSEFVPGIIKEVGEDAWNRLPPSAQAALASVAYNYGKLPFRVENAVVMGDPEEIARQVEALQTDNEGVNKGRRLREAAIIRGQAGISTPQLQAGGMAPEVEAYVSTISNPDEAALTRKAIYDQIGTQQTALKALSKAQEDQYENRIALGDAALTVDEIQGDPMLDDGQKAKLTNSWGAKNKDLIETRQSISDFAAGRLIVDGYSEAGRKTNDAVWASISATAASEQERKLRLDALVQQTGIIPTPVVNAVRYNLSGTDPKQAEAALQLGSHLRAVDPAALARSPSGGAVADQVALYDHYTLSLGLPSDVAARRILDAQDPDKARQRAALMSTEPMKKAIEGAATESNVRAIFGGGWLSSSPTLGKTAAQSAAIISDYRETLTEAIFDAGGDVDAGITLANDRFQRRYGTSSLSMDGPSSVMFLPPEKTYPADPKGSHDYIREQAAAELAAKGIQPKAVFLVPDETTEADARAGRAPRYQAWYTDSDGKYQLAPIRFFATPPTGSGRPATDPGRITQLEAVRQGATQWNADVSPADMAPGQMVTSPVQPIELGGPQPDHPAIQEISPSDMAPGPLTVPAGK
jgi:GH24 family phage-related lysozyme (muramidase)